MAIREGRWDCPHCGRTGNRGPARHCTGCGAPRGAEVKFYLPPDAAEVTAAEALAAARVGPDWTCGYCGGDNRAGDAFCAGCGGGKDGSAPRSVTEHRDPPPLPAPAAQSFAPAAAPAPGATKPPGCSRGCLKVAAIGGVFAALVIALLIWWVWPRSVELRAVSSSWQRQVEIQALRPVVEEAWEGEVPGGARVLDRRREVFRTDRVQVGTERKTRTVTERVQSGTERVKVGTRDLGNGYFEDIYEDRPVYRDERRQESYDEPVYEERPVYRQKVRYEIERWTTARTAEAAGEGWQAQWPVTRLAPREQAGTRTERYVVVFRDAAGHTYQHAFASEADWQRYAERGSIRAKVNRKGEITWLEGASR